MTAEAASVNHSAEAAAKLNQRARRYYKS